MQVPSASDDPIPELLRAREEGDTQRVARILEGYRDRLRRLVDFRLDRRLKRRVDASDILQEASIEALSRLDSYLRRPPMPLFLWLRYLTIQKLLQAHRRHLGAAVRDLRRDVPIHGKAHPETTSSLLADRLMATDTSPGAALARAERRAVLLEALDEMEPLDREIIGLRHFEGLSNAETAEVLGINGSTTSTRHVRALKRIKSILDRRSLG